MVNVLALSVFVIVKMICRRRLNMSVSVRCGCVVVGGGNGYGCDTGNVL